MGHSPPMDSANCGSARHLTSLEDKEQLVISLSCWTNLVRESLERLDGLVLRLRLRLEAQVQLDCH